MLYAFIFNILYKQQINRTFIEHYKKKTTIKLHKMNK